MNHESLWWKKRLYCLNKLYFYVAICHSFPLKNKLNTLYNAYENMHRYIFTVTQCNWVNLQRSQASKAAVRRHDLYRCEGIPPDSDEPSLFPKYTMLLYVEWNYTLLTYINTKLHNNDKRYTGILRFSNQIPCNTAVS